MFRISIPTPCHEDWHQMSPREQGAYCAVCAETVVDFTNLSDEQVQNYFLENAGKKTCGRFRNEQLTNNNADYLPQLISGDIPLWKKFLALVVILFAGLLTGCKERIIGQLSYPEVAAQADTTGLTPTDVEVIDEQPKDSLARTSIVTRGMVGVGIVEDIIIGDIAIEPPRVEEVMMGVPDIKPDTLISTAGQEDIFIIDVDPFQKDKTDSIKNRLQRDCDLRKDTTIYFRPG